MRFVRTVCIALIPTEDPTDSIRENAELSRLLHDMDTPLRRMDDKLKNIEDSLECG
jgi:hypothetical protein